MGLLSGLSGLGLGDLENVDIFESPEEKKKKEAAETAQVKHTVEEKDLIYEKAFTCPVCDKKFNNKIMKTGKAKLLGTDKDLRPRYEAIDIQKYDVILCPNCGYAALTRFFPHVMPAQAKMIRENISMKVHLRSFDGETYTHEEALERYQLALANAVVKHAKNSEKAYICLKSAWLARGYEEYLKESGSTDADKLKMAKEMEEEQIANAYKGFQEAIQTESFPMCGMDEPTLDYLLAVLSMRFENYDYAGRLVAKIVTSASANARIKDKARDLKEEIVAQLKKNK